MICEFSLEITWQLPTNYDGLRDKAQALGETFTDLNSVSVCARLAFKMFSTRCLMELCFIVYRVRIL